MHKLLNKNVIVLADQAIFSGGSFLITILLARVLGADNFGIYASLTLFTYSVISVLNAMVINPLQVSLDRIDHKKSYLSFNFWSQIALVIIMSVALFTILALKIQFLNSLNNLGYGLVIFFIGFLMQDYFRKLFLAQAKVYLALIVDLVTTTISIAIIYISWAYLHLDFKETILFLGLAYLPGTVISIVFINPNFKALSNWGSYLKLHYHQGKWLVLTAITQWWSGNLFIVASGLFLGIRALGAFRLVQSLFGILNILLQTLENYALPEATRLFINSSEEAKSYLRSISLRSAAMFGFVLVLLFIFSEEVIQLAGGAQYIEYAFVVKGMAILYSFIFIGYPVRMAIRMLLLNRVFFSGYLFSLFFSLVSYHFLLSRWNINGAIIGLILSQIIVIIYWQFILYKKQFILWK